MDQESWKNFSDKDRNLYFVYAIIFLGILARFIPHMPNLAPVTALAIFAAVYLPKKQAIALPLAVRFVSDIFLGFFAWQQMLVVYACHLFGVLLGLWVKSSESTSRRTIKIVSSGVISAALFFLATNLAFLYSVYPHTWAGVVESYANGLPFLRGTLMGDVGYTLALFGAYALATRANALRANKLEIQEA